MTRERIMPWHRSDQPFDAAPLKQGVAQREYQPQICPICKGSGELAESKVETLQAAAHA